MADTTIDAPPPTASAPVRHHLFESLESPIYRVIVLGSTLAFIAFNAFTVMDEGDNVARIATGRVAYTFGEDLTVFVEG